MNWPNDPTFEAEPAPDTLLIGGGSAEAGWWYQLVGSGGPNTDACWPLFGGAFDEGNSVWFSSGLRLPKAATFETRPSDRENAFPAHRDDFVCVDAEGRAAYLEVLVGR